MIYKSLLMTSVLLLALSCGDNAPAVKRPATVEKESTEVQERTDEKVIVFFGNSLTAGYGLEEGQDFPALIQERLDSLGMNYAVVNAGLSGETTAGGVNRIDWILRQPMDVFVLELGANDMLRGHDLSSTRANLKMIMDKVLAKNPKIQLVLAGMKAPPNLGEDYTTEFAQIYRDLSKEYNAALIPFLLDKVAGQPTLNLKDGIHPNALGQHVVRDNVWAVLQPLL